MAALTITDASTLPGTGATYTRKVAGETIATAGISLYLKTSDEKWYKADANLSAEGAGSGGVAISAHAALAGQPLNGQTGGVMAFGAILTVGQQYYLGATAGDIAPVSDLATGWYVTYLGIATTTGNLLMAPNYTGVVHA